eukprot:gene22198-23269_t
MKDAFIVKYDATAKGFQRHLSTHQDSSLLSFHIALSSPRSTGDLLPDARQAPRQSQSLRSSLKPPSNSSSSSLSPPQPQASLSEETKEKERERGKETEQQEGFLSGGTHFTLLDLTYRPDRGSLLTHPSRVYHAGAEIEGGRRYLLVGFVQVRHPDLLSSFWRKYGAVARCMSLREQAASNSTGTKASSLQSATHTAQGDGDNQIGMNKDIFKQGFRSINTNLYAAEYLHREYHAEAFACYAACIPRIAMTLAPTAEANNLKQVTDELQSYIANRKTIPSNLIDHL